MLNWRQIVLHCAYLMASREVINCLDFEIVFDKVLIINEFFVCLTGV